MNTDQQKALKTMAIKARLANTVRQQLYKKQLKEITEKEKVVFFDNLFKATEEMHWELNFLKQKRKAKAKIHKLRLEKWILHQKKRLKLRLIKNT